MKARLTAGLIHKATRGELALTLPTGLVRTSQGTVHKIPNQEAQARLSLVFETFLQCRSASKVVEVFNTHDLLLPAVTASAIWCGRLRVWPPCSPFSSIRPMRGRSPMAVAARCDERRLRHAPPSPVCPRSSGASASRTSTHLPSVGRRISRFRPCSKTITPSMTGTKPAGSRALAKPSCTASSTAGNAATRWSCSIRGHPLHLSLPPPTVSDPCVSIYCGRSGRYPVVDAFSGPLARGARCL